MDPISTGQLTRDEIERGEKDPNYRLKLGESKVALPPAGQEEGPALYAGVAPPRAAERDPVAGAQPPELKDAQIMRLVGTTKTTIASVRDRTHWNASTLTPMDPVTLGLCSQIELDFEVQRAPRKSRSRRLRRRDAAAGLRDHQEGAGIRADRKAARRPQRRRRVRQAEDDRRQEAGRRGIEVSLG
jgi:hypothetical protein